MSVLALGTQQGKSPEEQAVDDVVTAEKPPQSRIEIDDSCAQCAWRIPAKGGCSFMLVFASAWLAFCAVFVAAVFFDKGDGNTDGGALFISFFVLIGFGMLYAGLRMTRASHVVRLDSSEFAFERRFLGRTTRKTWPRGSVRSVALVVFYTENYKPIHGIEVRGDHGRIRFGSAMEPTEKAWLCRDLSTKLGLNVGTTGEKAEHNANSPLVSAVPVKESKDATRIRIEQTADYCIVTVPPGKKVRFLIVIGCFMLAIGGFMISQALRMWIPISDGPPILFLILFNGFIAFWCAGVAGILPVGIGLVTLGWNLSRTHQTIAANAARVVIETRFGSRTLQETWEAPEVRDVTVEPAFEWTSNGKRSDKHRTVILLPDRVRGFGTGHPPADLEMAAAALRAALGKSQPPLSWRTPPVSA